MSLVRIGIECNVTLSKAGRRLASVHESYIDAVVAAGGVPFLIPSIDDDDARRAQLETVDGLLLTGGDDIPASEYGEAELTCERTSHVDPRRYRAGLALTREATERAVPVLGICYGHQLLNVAFGGTLVQDIPIQVKSSVDHRSDVPGTDVAHEVALEPDSRLGRAIGRRASVCSAHHQSVGRVASGLKVVARADDGVVEALESEDGRFIVGVQWHPERMGPGKAGFDVVRLLVDAARESRR
jgi:putative glutamine amidotransferase